MTTYIAMVVFLVNVFVVTQAQGQCRNRETLLNTQQYPLNHNGSMYAGVSPNENVAVKLWDSATICFAIPRVWGDSEKRQLQKALNMITSRTCIQFVPSCGDKCGGPYVYFDESTPFTGGIGRQNRRQTVGANAKNLNSPAQVVHGIFHAMGFVHEEQRSDAAQYLNMPCGIPLGKKTETYLNSLGEFDYGSITSRLKYFYHNSACMGKARQQPIAINNQLLDTERTGPTNIDLEKVNRAYGCQRM